MRLFGRKRFDEMPTAEEQYRAEQERQRATQPSAAYRSVQTEVSRRWKERQKERQADTEERRKQVVRVGTIRRKGNTVVLEGGWQLATNKLPEGDLSHLVGRGKLGNLTVKDFHDLADNHGPDCHCGLGR